VVQSRSRAGAEVQRGVGADAVVLGRCRGAELEVLRAVVVQRWCRAGAEQMLMKNAAGAGKGGAEVVQRWFMSSRCRAGADV
jgi:hypothetical protein